MALPPQPKAEDFKDPESYQEALGFWRSRVGRIQSMSRVIPMGHSQGSPEKSADSPPAPSAKPKK